jgi:hypothetical protein
VQVIRSARAIFRRTERVDVALLETLTSLFGSSLLPIQRQIDTRVVCRSSGRVNDPPAKSRRDRVHRPIEKSCRKNTTEKSSTAFITDPVGLFDCATNAVVTRTPRSSLAISRTFAPSSDRRRYGERI